MEGITATAALTGVLRATAGHVAWLALEVQDLEGIKDDKSAILVRLYADERDRLARVAQACIASGIDKKEIELQQKTANQLARAVENAIKSVAGLTAEQRKTFGQVLRLELAQLSESAVESE
jgi:hypothetical protein